MRPYLENTQHKNKTGRVTQGVEHLPNNCETMSSKPGFTKKMGSAREQEEGRMATSV
jgi:hypothetical protein